MHTQARVVIIGAGIVGCSAAYHLSRLGWREIVVVDQGPLFETGGSISHAPGLVFQTNSSQTMCLLAQHSVQLYDELALDGQPCFYPVGSLEVAYTPERLEDLKRRCGWALSWGLEAEVIGPDEAQRRLPLLRGNAPMYGAFAVPADGIAKAVWACAAIAQIAGQRGVSFYGNTAVTGFEIAQGRMQAVLTDQGRIATENVLLCAGIWGPKVGRMAGVAIPLTPCQHQYVRTAPLSELAGETREVVHPILRYQEKALYARQIGDCYGVGSYQHEPLLVEPEAIRPHRRGEASAGSTSFHVATDASTPPMPSIEPFTPEHFRQPWEDICAIMPALHDSNFTATMNGMFSFTPDGLPLIGEAGDVRGFWVAEAVWVTHGGGVGKAVAEWMVEGTPGLDLRECDLNRFEPHAVSRSYVRTRGATQYDEVYDIIHPLQPMEQPRPLRVSPFFDRQRELGAIFFEGRGWERPQWYTIRRKGEASVLQSSNVTVLNGTDAALLQWGARTGWAARFWSPIVGAEHLATRENVALYDMTSLPKLEVSGPGAVALLQRLTTNQIDRPIGSVTYTVMCNERGGVRSDITVTRLAENHFQLGCNCVLDLHWLRRHAPADGSIHISDITASRCCVGLWGPKAYDLLQTLCEDDLSNAGFPFYTARRIFVNEVPVLALRVSYVGELGWELYTTMDYGLRLWDLLWEAGQRFSIIAGGRGAFDSLRLEKGYRLWGVDMHSDHNPYECGLGFTVNLEKGDFIGREALLRAKSQGISRKLCCLVLDDPETVVMGKEPIRAPSSDGGQVLGYVTSANYGYSIGKSIAYGWLPADYATVGTRVEIEYFGSRYAATVNKEPLFDPKGSRLKG